MGFPGDTPEEKMKNCIFTLEDGQMAAAHPQERFQGRIRELSPAADPRSRTFAARIAFTSAATPAELGQSARVFIAHEGLIPLAVPLSAVTAENGQAYVWRVNKDSRLERAVVRLGPYGADSVPVLEGLAPGDWVVAAGGHVLREGQEIRKDRNES